MNNPPSEAAVVASTTATALTDALYEGRFDTLHTRWRKLFATEPFLFREGLAPQERTELSYDRLRLVNDVVGKPVDLVRDIGELTALHEWIGVSDVGLCTVSSIHYNLFLGSLVDHDGERRDLTPYTDMTRTGTFLCTEAGHGNSVSQLETTATYDPAEGVFELHTPTPAAAKFMPNTSSTGGPKDAVVAARLIVGGTDHGVFLFLTPLHDDAGRPLPGITVTRLPQTSTSPVDHCRTVFDRVRLPYEAMLQADHGRLAPDGTFTSAVGSKRKRFLASVGRVTAGKLCMSAFSLGVTRNALAVAVAHAHNRRTSGVRTGETVPLFAYRSHHAPLVEALATTYAASFLQRWAVRRWAEATEPEQQEDAERAIAVAKGWITWQGRAVMTECRERCGAQGLFLVNGIAGQIPAHEGAITAEGDNLVIWAKAAGELLLGHFTPQPPVPVPDGADRLTSPEHLQALLGDIERVWHQRARTRLRAGRPGDPLGRWNQASTPALRLVEAHARRLAGAALLEAADRTADAQAQELLYALHRLFALRSIAPHTGDLLLTDRLRPEDAVVLPDATDEVIGELVPAALTLVAGFGIAEELLSGYPIATRGTGELPY
ncbi:acyl-CoA dehydrogenase [Streptomyces sp. NPDC017673]|uniref:acyl-CoA dehydrogenase family protein n=1 Tax=unclassified Streptomyces TaxID=2593676 RepID=UPI0037B79324